MWKCSTSVSLLVVTVHLLCVATGAKSSESVRRDVEKQQPPAIGCTKLRMFAVKVFSSAEDDDDAEDIGVKGRGSGGKRHGRRRSSSSRDEKATTFRVAHQSVYLWPSFTDHERSVIRDAFRQISRRTCIRFKELDYKPWYHADRWNENQPYVVIRKSKKFSGYSDNTIEGVNRRSLLYLTNGALNHASFNQSRGMVMAQLLRFMGYREEHLRPDANSYLQRIGGGWGGKSEAPPRFSAEQLQWPFDPESITIPATVRQTHRLTFYCQARQDASIGAGQRTGLLTRWDAVKLNSMYCPQRVGYADPRLGPCVQPRRGGNRHRQR